MGRLSKSAKKAANMVKRLVKAYQHEVVSASVSLSNKAQRETS